MRSGLGMRSRYEAQGFRRLPGVAVRLGALGSVSLGWGVGVPPLWSTRWVLLAAGAGLVVRIPSARRNRYTRPSLLGWGQYRTVFWGASGRSRVLVFATGVVAGIGRSGIGHRALLEGAASTVNERSVNV